MGSKVGTSRESTPKRKHRKIKVTRKGGTNRIIWALDQYGINKRVVGPLVLSLIIRAILYALGFKFKLKSEVKIDDLRQEIAMNRLSSKGVLERIEPKGIPNQKLQQAVKYSLSDQASRDYFEMMWAKNKFRRTDSQTTIRA
ncbi:MAG: hypothetical protein ACYC7D_01520 [Nitrososphaerales archaeon]